MTRAAMALGLSLGFAACAGPAAAPTWQKAGATEATTAADTTQCRAGAQGQAARLYPHGSNIPTMGGAGMIAAHQQANTDRLGAEDAIFNECMEGRGYKRSPK